MDVPIQSPLVILRVKQLQLRLGAARATIYDWLNPKSPRYDPTFPKQIRLSRNSVGWLEHEVNAWLLARIAASRPYACAP